MTYTWIYIMLLMFAGSFILQMVPLLFYFEAVIAVNLLILAASWFILRRDRFSDFRSNILFMAGLTIINILTDLGILTHSMSWVAFGALLIWSRQEPFMKKESGNFGYKQAACLQFIEDKPKI